MNEFKVKDPDVWQNKTHGGCLFLFGLPFLAVGIAMLIGLGESSGDAPEYVRYIFGGVFAIAGLFVMFARKKITIDRRTMMVTTKTTIFIPIKKKEYPLGKFERVTLSKEVRRSDKSTYTVYPVRLSGGEGAAGVDDFLIEEPQNDNNARKLAEEMSAFLGLELVDSSSGSPITRGPDTLDENLRQKAWRTGDKNELPDMPAEAMRSVIRPGVDGTVIEIPPVGYRAISFLALIPALIFSGFVYFMFFRKFLDSSSGKVGQKPDLVFLVFIICFMALPLLITLIGIFLRARKRSRVTFSSTFLRVDEIGLIKTTTTEIPAVEIEELTQNIAITARSDAKTVSFGKGLNNDELKYIHALVKQAIAG